MINFNTDGEIKPMVFDILRLLTMQILTQFLVSINNSKVSFLSKEFIQVSLFLVLSNMVFWMIIYKFFNKNKIIEKYLK